MMYPMLIPLIIAGGLILFLALLGLIAVSADRRRRRQREELLAERRARPSSLRLPSPPPQEEEPEPPPAPVSRPAPVSPPAVVSSAPAASILPPSPPPPSRIETPVLSSPIQQVQSPAQTPLPQPSVGISPLLAEPSSFSTDPAGEIDFPPPSVAFPSKDQPPQILFLDPDYEIAEIKRVLRIWQMTQDPDSPTRWKNSDGTQIELRDRDGYPCLEIRGPLASDLAEYLPQDLPIRPDLAHPPT